MKDELCGLSDFTKVYQMLSDDESKDIYLKRINYLVTHDFKYIQEIIDTYIPQFKPRYATVADQIARITEDKDFVLYGAGKDGSRLLPYLKGNKRFIGFCSKTKEKQINGYLGYPTMSPEELLARKDLNVIISTHDARDEIMKLLFDSGYPKDLIFDQADFLCDAPVEMDPNQYFDPSFMTYQDDEVFIDAGCCDLSTSLNLKRYCKNLKKVYAFEPDPVCYRHCLEKKKQTNFEQAEIFPYGTWSARTTLSFTATNDGSSRISPDGGLTRIDVIPIDEVITPGEQVTFIKMDVEGSELESLRGARQTIQRDKPKLAICIYHKPEDLITIPLYIKELVPEYKLYVRHHSNESCETVLYAVIP